MEYIYLIQINENLKIGKSKRFIYDRLKEYKNGITPKVHLVISCSDCSKSETEIKSIFDVKFKKQSDFGYEYYSGDVDVMKKTIMNYFGNQEQNNTHSTEISTQTDLQSEVIKPIFTIKPKRVLTDAQMKSLEEGRKKGHEKLKEKQTKQRALKEIEQKCKEITEYKMDLQILKLEKELNTLNNQSYIQKKKNTIETLQEQIELLKNEIGHSI